MQDCVFHKNLLKVKFGKSWSTDMAKALSKKSKHLQFLEKGVNFF